MNTNRTHSIAHLVLSASAALALAGSAMGQGAAVAPPAPPEPPTPIHSFTSVSSSWSTTQSVDGRTISLNSKDGKLSAEVDGKAVPEDRIVERNGSVRIKGEKGETLFETAVPGSDPVVQIGGPLGSTNSLGGLMRRGSRFSSSPTDRTIHVIADAPKVMVGVQLLEPDSSLRGHLGLKENETTLISAVYEGLAAAQAGLEPYDIVVAINGKSPSSPEVLRKALRETDAGKSIALDVIHRGAKKTVTITVEKYDEEKLEKAKVNAIAAASGTPSGISIAGSPIDGGGPGAWAIGPGTGNPFVATIPGANGQPNKSITLWGRAGADQEELAQRLQALAERAQEQASRADEQAKRLHEQMMSGGMGGQNMLDLNRVMEERMKKMEEMMQKMMEQRNAAPAPATKKDEGKS